MTQETKSVRTDHKGQARELLTTMQMYSADRLAIDGGTPGITLMENAGAACADVICRHYEACRVTVLCGAGNNGGDGFVIARLLHDRGWTVKVALAGNPERIKGDAAEAFDRWKGDTLPLTNDVVGDAELIIDAVFGAGLSKPIEGAVADLIAVVNESDTPVVAVDVPSGVDGTTGEMRGCAFQAERTVTFFRKKTGHLLMPGRELCGNLDVVDIGIPAGVLSSIGPVVRENGPEVWTPVLPAIRTDGHKYSRGHALVVSGGRTSTGAARLGARAALRAGAGLVTVASPLDAVSVNAAHLTAIMLLPFDSAGDLTDILADRRKNAVLIGPGGGAGDTMRSLVEAALRSGASVVLDADALTSFAGHFDGLRDVIAEIPDRTVVATPHEGEFSRLFTDQVEMNGSKLDRARQAAEVLGAVLVLKGPDTVIADPSGQAVINSNAPPTLGTAGSGDVLAGLITGLLAQGMPGFEAACAGTWLHGAAANQFGPGLIAEDLPDLVPAALRELALMRSGLKTSDLNTSDECG